MRFSFNRFRALHLLILALAVVAVAQSQTTVKSSEDSYTYMAEPTLTHNDAVLRVRTALPTGTDQTTFRNTYIKFDLRTGVTGPITSAKLVLGLERASLANTASVNRADFYSLADDSWLASTITWANAPAKGVRLLSVLIATRSNSAADTSYTFDITNYVKQEFAGDKIVSICITDDSLKGPDIRFNSSRSTKVSPAVTTPLLIINSPATAVDNQLTLLPDQLELQQNYPNPFNPGTVITFRLSNPGDMSLVVFDLSGREIRHLATGYHNAGQYSRQWDGCDDNGVAVASGVYYARLRTDRGITSIKMALIR